MLVFFFFFFFQAEDGIRDVAVTGVQTCALPIYRRPTRSISVRPSGTCCIIMASSSATCDTGSLPITCRRRRRSEERRVGKGVDLGGRRIIKKKKNRNIR